MKKHAIVNTINGVLATVMAVAVGEAVYLGANMEVNDAKLVARLAIPEVVQVNKHYKKGLFKKNKTYSYKATVDPVTGALKKYTGSREYSRTLDI